MKTNKLGYEISHIRLKYIIYFISMQIIVDKNHCCIKKFCLNRYTAV